MSSERFWTQLPQCEAISTSCGIRGQMAIDPYHAACSRIALSVDGLVSVQQGP
jgi:hypothetical protein